MVALPPLKSSLSGYKNSERFANEKQIITFSNVMRQGLHEHFPLRNLLKMN